MNIYFYIQIQSLKIPIYSYQNYKISYLYKNKRENFYLVYKKKVWKYLWCNQNLSQNSMYIWKIILWNAISVHWNFFFFFPNSIMTIMRREIWIPILKNEFKRNNYTTKLQDFLLLSFMLTSCPQLHGNYFTLEALYP